MAKDRRDSTKAKILDELTPFRTQGRNFGALNREDGLAVLRALRRGVTEAEIVSALGMPGLQSVMGTWAKYFCHCVPGGRE